MLILGATHLYKGEGIPFDPEGILGTLPSVVNLLAGYAAVIWLRRRPVDIGTTGRILVAGAVFLTLALIWNIQLPINKKLWTSSYVLCTVGIDLLILGALVLVIDIWGVRSGTRYFEVFGKNTLFIYVLAEILMAVSWTVQINKQPMFMWIYSNGFQWWAGGKVGSLLFAIAFAQFCWMIGYMMDKKRIYIRF
jgi:predicted acyltransferase